MVQQLLWDSLKATLSAELRVARDINERTSCTYIIRLDELKSLEESSIIIRKTVHRRHNLKNHQDLFFIQSDVCKTI